MLVKHRKTENHPDMTEKLLREGDNLNKQTKESVIIAPNNSVFVCPKSCFKLMRLNDTMIKHRAA